VREEAIRADREAAQAAPARGDEDDEVEQPLMEGEITRSQDGVAPGQERAYAHRDIKPGMCLDFPIVMYPLWLMSSKEIL
jgi:serine/threonine kinase 16